MRHFVTTAAACVLALGAQACTTARDVPEPIADATPDLPPVAPATPPANPWTGRELPFDPSDADVAFLGTGFTGYVAVPAETRYTQGVRVAGVQPGQALAVAGLADGDVIVRFAGQVLDGPPAELIQQLREVLKPLAPDSLTSLAYWREGAGITETQFWLGRSPPPFADMPTPDDWFTTTATDARLDAWVQSALALDNGEARFADTLKRQRERFDKRDVFRLKETVQAQLNPTAQERIAAWLVEELRRDPVDAAAIAAGGPQEFAESGHDHAGDWAATGHEIADFLVPRATWLREHLADWSPEEREWLAANFQTLTDHAVAEAEYIYGDDDVARERTNRRIVGLLARVDRAGLARVAGEIRRFVARYESRLADLAQADERPGLLFELETDAGRIEFWGRGNQRHTKRCLFRFDAGGDDNYLDTAARADLTQPISINVDAAGDDIYGATAPFCQAGAFGGVALLFDEAGDDQYLAQQWGQGAAVAGFALLHDRSGNDTYRGREACQGVALVGGAVLLDDGGADTYSGDRFCQGVGFAAGVGALLDTAGDDRYSCTGRYPSEYGEDGVFSGWGQGVGFGFRGVTSGGIGLLHDLAGDDIYEAGNFSQGGAYFFAWGILRDDAGSDRYIGSRYAQGYAAHEAAGTFVDGGGNDLYQSHAGVAQGLSWDETSVLFRDHGGNDRYETRGFSLASAAHNGMVVFVDDSGDDTYADLPAKANSNNYHGGNSFALFVDVAGHDHYEGRKDDEWNGRAFWRHDGAYTLDLDGDRPIPDLVRTTPEHD